MFFLDNSFNCCYESIIMYSGEMLLWQACQENDLEKVVELVKSNAPLEIVDGKTCIEVAVENGNR